MKQFITICIVLVLLFIGVDTVYAQSRTLTGMSFNGATGLYTIPSARTGWNGRNNFGIDMGYHAIISEGHVSHIPKASMTVLNWIEFHTAFDIQPDWFNRPYNGSDLIIGAKIQLPLPTTAVALGGNFQRLNITNDNYGYNAGQFFMAVSYPGRIFGNQAETTVVVGKTLRQHVPADSSIDFGMGFSLSLLPGHLGGLVHWVTDVSNFSYSVEPFAADNWHRGVINSGLRFDFSVIPAFRRLKFVIDILITDAFDSNRAFSTGVVIGVPFL